ncbi:hypothetical protein CSV79_02220 [Sporosarcina sp. P13]|uniref:YrrS family protein n=1 Tax=Sporosarcina sp. P13 TaxID=2048263 RepID=UPI000C1716D7|nr:YrrS family protein [Sporosarcina sp. P13]PIC65458.1 hypothetical protein CSV79_02220 [Sporosarcina sp. P13]
MADRDPNLSRTSRKKGNKTTSVNKTLNILIGVVVLLILVVGITFVLGDDKEEANVNQQTGVQQAEQAEQAPIEPIFVEENEAAEDLASSEEQKHAKAEDEAVESETPAEKPVVEETQPVVEPEPEPKPEPEPTKKDPEKKSVVDPNWKPVGTKQTGQHVSKYDGTSTDWHEKKKAISYATGKAEKDLIYLRIQNGGSPQKAEGIVTTLDNSKKYKVYLEWVDGQGWKPVKMDVMK